jgi:hypothetical protein
MVRPMPLALMVVGKTSAHQTKDGPSINWKSTMKKKMKTTQAMLPPLFAVERNERWRRASVRRSAATIGKPITVRGCISTDMVFLGSHLRNNLLRPKKSMLKMAMKAAIVPMTA